jgi:hypothetical protein
LNRSAFRVEHALKDKLAVITAAVWGTGARAFNNTVAGAPNQAPLHPFAITS